MLPVEVNLCERSVLAQRFCQCLVAVCHRQDNRNGATSLDTHISDVILPKAEDSEGAIVPERFCQNLPAVWY